MNGRGAMHSRNGPPVGAIAPAKTADPSAGDRLPALMMAGEKGNSMETAKRNVEDVLTSTRAECLRGIENSTSDGGRRAWYYTHCGEIEMAFNLGLISQARFDELRAEWKAQQPT